MVDAKPKTDALRQCSTSPTAGPTVLLSHSKGSPKCNGGYPGTVLPSWHRPGKADGVQNSSREVALGYRFSQCSKKA